MSVRPWSPQPIEPLAEMPGPKASTGMPRTQAHTRPVTWTGSNRSSEALMTAGISPAGMLPPPT